MKFVDKIKLGCKSALGQDGKPKDFERLEEWSEKFRIQFTKNKYNVPQIAHNFSGKKTTYAGVLVKRSGA